MNFNEPLSYVGTRIYKSESARLGEARRFFRVASSLSLGRKSTLAKFARYIRHGFLAVSDCQDLLLGRMTLDKLRRYQLAKYWISSGFDEESAFYFNPAQLWPEKEKDVESITLFP